MDRAAKERVVEDLGHIFSSSGAVVVCHYQGLTVAEMQDLRSQMRDVGASVRVAKNRLARIALEGQPCEGIKPLFTGQTALAYAEDPVSPAKIADSYAKRNAKLKILGGAMGETVLDEAGVKTLAAMPSREEVLSSIVGALMAPGSNLASAITAPASDLAGIVQTLSEREES